MAGSERAATAARMRGELARLGKKPAWLYRELNQRGENRQIRYPVGSRATIYKVLADGTANLELLSEIANVLRVRYSWLLTGEGERDLPRAARNCRPSETAAMYHRLDARERDFVRKLLGEAVAEAVLTELRWPAPMWEESLYVWRPERWKALKRLDEFLKEHGVTDTTRRIRAATAATALLVLAEQRLMLNTMKARKARTSLMYGQLANHIIEAVALGVT
jgi:hypothetical protein